MPFLIRYKLLFCSSSFCSSYEHNAYFIAGQPECALEVTSLKMGQPSLPFLLRNDNLFLLFAQAT